jgi:osmotically-inducible protein OsmY
MNKKLTAVAITGLAWTVGGCAVFESDADSEESGWIPQTMAEHTDPYEPARESGEPGMLSQSRANAATQGAGTSPAAATTATTATAATAQAAPTPALSADARDAYLQGRVETIYDLNPRLASQDLDVRVVGGTVYLSGTVDTDIERDLAVDLARSVDDIQGVESTLAVRTPPPVMDEPPVVDDRTMSERMEDANVTAAVRQALVDDARTRGAAIDVITMRGQVTLRGLVPSGATSVAAGEVAAGIPGVRGVTNGLSVR